MYVLTAEQMRRAEGHTIQELGVPALLLMENAGRAVAVVAWHVLTGEPVGSPILRRLRSTDGVGAGATSGADGADAPGTAGVVGTTGPAGVAGATAAATPAVPAQAGDRPRVVAVAGKGNNGGDALVAARHLAAWGCEVEVLLWARPDTLPPDAHLNLQAVRRMGIPVHEMPAATEAVAPAPEATPATEAARGPAPEAVLRRAHLVIDGLLGTGVKGPARGSAAAGIAALNRCGRPVLAVDLPSGTITDTGAVPGPAVAATWTVALGAPKPVHLLYPGAQHCGEVWVAEIGIPAASVQEAAPEAPRLLTPAAAGALLPIPGPDAHKGSRGRLLVVGGSRAMPGAPALAGMAALRGGAGLVYVAVPEPAGDLVAMRSPELITHRLPADPTGGLARAALTPLLELARGVQALALGPGLGTGPEAQTLFRELVAQLPAPAVLDADGLRAFAQRPEELQAAGVPLILTPHPGELAALLGITTAEIQADRLGALAQAVARTGQTVVLKGPHTLVGAPDGRIWFNLSGNRALATAGSGDVLTGLAAALLAQGLAPPEAAAAAVAWHGRAGDRLAARMGADGVLAGDLLPELPPTRGEMQEWVVSSGL